MLTPGGRERVRREAAAQWRRQRIAAIRAPSLKSGVITVGSGFGGTGKTDVAVTLAAIYAATRPADRVILADTNDDMPHGYSRLGGAPVERLPRHRRPLSIRGFHHACVEDRIEVYADLRDVVAWLQGVAVIRGDTADECAGADFGEQEYVITLEFLQRMSNIVINDGGTGLFAKLQMATLLHGDKYVFVTEASQLGFWSIRQVFSRYRHYEGEKERPLTEQEMKHLNELMDEATVVVNKFASSDPEQARWLAQIRESFDSPHVSVVATPWDQSLANRVPLDLGAVAGPTLDAKLAMAEVVLHGADRAYRRRHGVPEQEAGNSGAAGMINDLVVGDAQVAFINAASTASMIKAGKLRPIAVLAESRLAEYPDVPTLAEAGFPGVGTLHWQSMLAPAHTPKEVLATLYKSIIDAANAPALQEAFKKQLVSVKPNASLEEAQSWLNSELAAWRKTVAEVKIDLSD